MGRNRATARRVAVVAALAVAGVGATVAPAAASEGPDLLVSTDGVVFAAAASEDLLDGLALLIPGQATTASLWVRNPTPAPAQMRISARQVQIPSEEFGESVWVAVRDQGTGAATTAPLARVDACDLLVPQRTVAAGGTERFDITFTMDDVDGETAQGEAAGMSLLVAMRDAEAGPFPTSACDDDGVVVGRGPAVPASSGALARTGTSVPIGALAIGAHLLGAGLFLLAGRRRRRSDDRLPQ